MPQIEKEIIHGGMRIKHPSGHVSTQTLEDLKYLRKATERFIKFFQNQIRMIDADIKRVEAASK